MPWNLTQSGNLNPKSNRFFPNAVFLDSAGTSQSITGTGSGIFIPFGDLESYKVTTSGDIRELVYSIVDKVAIGIASLSGLPNQPKPERFTIFKSVSATETSASKTFTIGFNLNSSSTVYDVQDEG